MGSTYAPLRPPTEKDTIHLLNGMPVYLGAMVSAAGAAVSNLATATPFNFAQSTPQSMAGTLAGKVLLVQASATCFILPTASSPLVVATQTTIPPLPGTSPGVQIPANTASIVIMRPDAGWLQAVGTAAFNLLVWELT
jgi:stage V sporulation protein SpoVS